MTPEFRELKAAFKRCMCHLFSDGPRDEFGVVCNLQVRSMVHVFVMGWCESLAAGGGPKAVLRLMNVRKELEQMVEEDWMPDPSWHWWDGSATGTEDWTPDLDMDWFSPFSGTDEEEPPDTNTQG